MLCLVGGTISALALLDITTENALAHSWAATLRTFFGEGSLVIVTALGLLGLRWLLPGGWRGISLTRRLLGMELAFLALLALLHLSQGAPELASILLRGRAGGIIGWALGNLSSLIGPVVSALFYGFVLLLGSALALGMGRRNLVVQLRAASRLLDAQSCKLLGEEVENNLRRPEPDQALPRFSKHHGQGPATRPRQRLLRIARPKPQKPLPPSRRPRPISPPSGPQATPMALATTASALPLSNHSDPPDGSQERSLELPALEYLSPDSEETLEYRRETERCAALIESTLRDFEIEVEVVDIQVGPTVTQYAIQPYRARKNGYAHPAVNDDTRNQLTRISKIAALQDDLALALQAKRLRMQAPVPGKRVIGIEIPNRKKQRVTLRSVYESASHQDALRAAPIPLYVPLGRDVGGQPVGMHIASLPHLLIAGTTGSGKSVCITALLSALLLDHGPQELQLVLLDPKMVELLRFQGIPQLVGPVETEADRIVAALQWCVGEMTRRYQLLEEAAARNLTAYNAQASETLPYLLIVIDEIGDLMLMKGAEIERCVVRLAQMARAVGMHLIVATQRPSVDIFTGLIKANFPARIAFQVPSGADSRVVLDNAGAESLLGQGDMLYLAPDAMSPRRIQGCYVSDEEVRALVGHWSAWQAEQMARGAFPAANSAPWARQLREQQLTTMPAGDAILLRAIQTLRAEGLASASLLQRRLGLGYPRAARIIDSLDELGFLGDTLPGGRGRSLNLPADDEELYARITTESA